MFENIGQKLQSLAKVVCWIGIVISVIAGIAAMTTNVLAGLIAIVIGALASWIGSWTLYAFGQLVEDVHEIKNK